MVGTRAVERNLNPREQGGEDRDPLTEWELHFRCVLMLEPCGHIEFPTGVRVRPCYLILLSRKERLRVSRLSKAASFLRR